MRVGWALIVGMSVMSSDGTNKPVDLMDLDRNMKVERVEADDPIDWYSPQDAPFDLYGLSWEESKPLYRRLPVNRDDSIPFKVDRLANAPAGGQIHFATNSRKLWIKVSLAGTSWRYHMTPVGTYGCDAYRWVDGKPRFAGITRFNQGDLEYTAVLKVQESAEMSDFAINLPLYNAVEKIEIGGERGRGEHALARAFPRGDLRHVDHARFRREPPGHGLSEPAWSHARARGDQSRFFRRGKRRARDGRPHRRNRRQGADRPGF